MLYNQIDQFCVAVAAQDNVRSPCPDACRGDSKAALQRAQGTGEDN